MPRGATSVPWGTTNSCACTRGIHGICIPGGAFEVRCEQGTNDVSTCICSPGALKIKGTASGIYPIPPGYFLGDIYITQEMLAKREVKLLPFLPAQLKKEGEEATQPRIHGADTCPLVFRRDTQTITPMYRGR